jgi:hypothetical protein
VRADLDIDTREFSAAARQLAGTMRRRSPNFMAQVGLDVASQAFEETPPFGPGDGRMQTKRTAINRYLNEWIGDRRIRKKSGKRVAKQLTLMRKHLIVQARRAARGLPGLYGKAMLHNAGRFTARAQQSVGFLKSLFIPIIRTLNATPGKMFRYARSKYNRISVWPGSDGSGMVNIEGKGTDVVSVIMELKARIRDTEAGKVQDIVIRALRRAIAFKTGKMQRELARLAGEVVAPSMPGVAGGSTGRILSQQRRSMATAHGRAQYGRG